MKTAVCDSEAFYPIRDFVKGPIRTIENLAEIERFLRTVVLHDEMVMEITPWPYDAEADAVYITVGDSKAERTEETGPFIYDVDADGHIVGIEILAASKVLAPGDWKKAGSRAGTTG